MSYRKNPYIAASRAGMPFLPDGTPVILSYTLSDIEERDDLTKWERLRCWFQDAVRRAGLSWPSFWPMVDRNKIVPKPYAVKMGHAIFMHPILWEQLRSSGGVVEIAEYPGETVN